MNFKRILDLEAFQNVFGIMRQKDPDFAENIQQSLEAVLEDTHAILKIDGQSPEKYKVALLKEQINVQAQASQYLNICDQLSYREKNLWQFAFNVTNEFFDRIFNALDLYFAQKKRLMISELEKEADWYVGIVDFAKKGGTIINLASKNVNKFAEKYVGEKLFEQKDLDSRTIVEVIVEKHLNENIVEKDVATVLEKATDEFNKAWLKQISEQTPNVDRLSAFTVSGKTSSLVSLPLQFGATEQALLMGIGAYVIASVGLAAGWHTITYALSHLFPPLLLLTAVATFLTGQFTKEQALEQRKKQIEETVNRYHRFFLTYLDATPLKELNNVNLRKYMNQVNEKIVNNTVLEWEKNILGKLTTEDYRSLNNAFSRHLALIEEAIDSIDDSKE